MLRPLLPDDFPAAAALLTEGFPQRGEAFWQQGLQLLARHAGNRAVGVPLGMLMWDGNRPVGVALMPASPRQQLDGTQRVLVNLSSWYVQPAQRWRAALMLRAMVAEPGHTYVDLTPSGDVERMLPLFGFRAVNRGTTIALLPQLLLGPGGGARVRPLRSDDRLPDRSPTMDQLMAHRELGCHSLLLEHNGDRTLLVYRHRTIRKLPGARLKYIGSHVAMQRHLPVVARHLLARGVLMLSWDTRDEPMQGRAFVHRAGGIWYARGDTFDDCTDFVGTELCILGV